VDHTNFREKYFFPGKKKGCSGKKRKIGKVGKNREKSRKIGENHMENDQNDGMKGLTS
jgi:hypothetical protein